MSEWQTIGTAPKGGTEILLCWEGTVGVGYFSLKAYSRTHKRHSKGWTYTLDAFA